MLYSDYSHTSRWRYDLLIVKIVEYQNCTKSSIIDFW